MELAKNVRLGIICALLAAFFNSTSGIFAKLLIDTYTPGDIAFGKCVIAFVFLGIWVALSGRWRRLDLRGRAMVAVAVCALFGIFGLFTFETIAYQGMAAPLVVLTLIGSSTITTLLAGHFFYGERITRNTLFCLVMIMSGLLMMLPHGAHAEPRYLLMAICSGACYGGFLVLAKYLNLAEGLEGTWLLIGIGTLYLLPLTSMPGQLLLNAEAWRFLLPLAIFPTILGYFFTVKALRNAPASTVQLFEISEPVFSAILAFLVLREFVTLNEGIGSLVVVASLLVYQFNLLERLLQRRPQTSE
ncbi:MAG: DMT family transporter [Paucimonas sp.]|jgi:drug/metabolite transporter (DMT)-like permease|nr:DMT family transporter [Paucimonas sp.]